MERYRQINSGFVMVWHPYSSIRFWWDCYVLVLTLAAFVYMPFQVFFACPLRYDSIIIFCDASACMDVIFNFITGYCDEDQKIINLDPKKIAIRYLRTNFLFDLIGSLPLQIIEIFEDCQPPSHTIFFLLKLFRFKALNLKWKNLHEQLDLSFITTTCVSISIQMSLFFHWMCYIFYQIPAFIFHFEDDMLKKQEWFKRHKVGTNNSFITKYLTSLYNVFGICIGAGYYKPVKETVIEELLLTSVVTLVGLAFVTRAVMILLRVLLHRQHEKYLYNGRLEELEEYMTAKNLPKILREKIRLFLAYKFNGNYFNEAAILKTINDQMKQDINMHFCRRLVLNVPLFQDLPVALINTIIFGLVHKIYMPGESLIECKEPGNSMFMISSGTVSVTSTNKRELSHLKDGSYFGEQALLRPGAPRTVSCVALEITEAYELSSKMFETCLQPYPHLKRRIEDSNDRRSRISLGSKKAS